MPDPVRVTSPDDPLVRDFRDLRDAKLREEERAGRRGRFIAESELVVRQLFASRCRTLSILTTPAMWARLSPDAPAEAQPLLAEPAVLSEIVGFSYHRGVMACGLRPAAPELDALLRDAATLVLLEHLVNQDNVGAVFRNVACLAGAGAAVLLSPDCCDPLYRKSIRVSAGHALRVPFARLDPWEDGLDLVKRAGWTLLALTPTGDTDVRDAAGIRRVALLLGAEGPGLAPASLARADRRVRIPMAPGVDSLNVATAAAVALSHLGPLSEASP